jgi:hypothetical protein
MSLFRYFLFVGKLKGGSLFADKGTLRSKEELTRPWSMAALRLKICWRVTSVTIYVAADERM